MNVDIICYLWEICGVALLCSFTRRYCLAVDIVTWIVKMNMTREPIGKMTHENAGNTKSFGIMIRFARVTCWNFQVPSRTPAFLIFGPWHVWIPPTKPLTYMKMSTWKFPKMVGFPNKHRGFPTKSDHFGGVLGVPPFKGNPHMEVEWQLGYLTWFNWRLHLTCPTPDHLTGNRVGQISWVHWSPNVFLVPGTPNNHW